MNCTEARSVMLACELAELSPQGGNALAQHIQQCAECRALAVAIVGQTATLRTAMEVRAHAEVGRPFRHRRTIGAITLAAGLLVAVTLSHRAPHPPVRPTPPAATSLGTVTIENAQGRPVTIVEGRNGIDVVFHYPEPNE